jgi:tetratricopeptide (TPR) repeat protein
MSRLAVPLIGLVLGASAAFADARQDCSEKSGDAAIRACTEAIRRDPKDVLSHVNRAYEYLAKGDHERSIADYSKAIELDPRRWDALQGRAWVYFKAGRAADGPGCRPPEACPTQPRRSTPAATS